ncbi:MAG: hypothetical protein D6773_18465, partial [Alphaproteobacteria bacterium]
MFTIGWQAAMPGTAMSVFRHQEGGAEAAALSLDEEPFRQPSRKFVGEAHGAGGQTLQGLGQIAPGGVEDCPFHAGGKHCQARFKVLATHSGTHLFFDSVYM